MAQLTLKRLLRRNRTHYSVIENIAKALSSDLAILDDQDNVLLGSAAFNHVGVRTDINLNGHRLGWVCGPEQARTALACLLQQILEIEGEKRDLSLEVLNSYRELNLLYDLSERLIAAPEPPAIANMALKEAGRLVDISAAWILLHNGDDRVIPIARMGKSIPFRSTFFSDKGLVETVLKRGEAEIRNNVSLSSLFDVEDSLIGDLICAPLKTDQRHLGVMLIVGEDPIRFEAHHLKLVNTVALQVGPALEIARLYQVAIEKGRMEQELRLAYEVQANLIPRKKPDVPGWQFAGRWLPALELSGDYYDFIPLKNGKLGLVIGDVADKGMPSSLFMVYTRSAVRSSVAQIEDTAQAINQANALVAEESHNGLFVTLLYASLEPKSGRLTYVNAGHNPALLVESNGQSMHELINTGIPLGILPDFQYWEEEIDVEPGDYLIFYTDGVTEAVNDDFEEFGTGQLKQVIKDFLGCSAEEMANGIKEAVLDFTGERPLHDDLTIVVLMRDGTES